MHRLGFEKQELEALAAYLPDAKSVKIASVFSHFAASLPLNTTITQNCK